MLIDKIYTIIVLKFVVSRTYVMITLELWFRNKQLSKHISLDFSLMIPYFGLLNKCFEITFADLYNKESNPLDSHLCYNLFSLTVFNPI